MLRRDYAFLQILAGTGLFFIFVSFLLLVTTGAAYGQTATMLFSILGMVVGLAGGFLVLDAYYKLTGKLGLEKYQIDEEIVEVTPSYESEVVNTKIKDVSLPPLVTVAMIERGGDLIPPRGDTEIKAYDQVILAGRPDVVEDVAELFRPSE